MAESCSMLTRRRLVVVLLVCTLIVVWLTQQLISQSAAWITVKLPSAGSLSLNKLVTARVVFEDSSENQEGPILWLNASIFADNDDPSVIVDKLSRLASYL